MVDRPAGQPVDAPTRPIRSASRGAERCAVRGPRLARHQRARHWPDGTPRCYLQYLPDERSVASTSSQRGSANGPCPAGRARVAYRSPATLWRRSVRSTANYFGISRTSTGLCRSRPRSSSRTLLWRHCWTHLNKGRSDAQPEVTKRSAPRDTSPSRPPQWCSRLPTMA